MMAKDMSREGSREQGTGIRTKIAKTRAVKHFGEVKKLKDLNLYTKFYFIIYHNLCYGSSPQQSNLTGLTTNG